MCSVGSIAVFLMDAHHLFLILLFLAQQYFYSFYYYNCLHVSVCLPEPFLNFLSELHNVYIQLPMQSIHQPSLYISVSYIKPVNDVYNLPSSALPRSSSLGKTDPKMRHFGVLRCPYLLLQVEQKSQGLASNLFI